MWEWADINFRGSICERYAVYCPEHAFPSSRSFFNTRLETENDSTHEGFIGREAWEIARKSQRHV
jgi:hypothetical protein